MQKKSTKRRSIANARSYKFPGTLNKVVVFGANEESGAAAYNVARELEVPLGQEVAIESTSFRDQEQDDVMASHETRQELRDEITNDDLNHAAYESMNNAENETFEEITNEAAQEIEHDGTHEPAQNTTLEPAHEPASRVANEDAHVATIEALRERMDVDHETVVEGMNKNEMEAGRVEVADFLYFNRIVNIPMFWRSIKAFKHARNDCIGVDNVEIEKETNRGVSCFLHFRCSACHFL